MNQEEKNKTNDPVQDNDKSQELIEQEEQSLTPVPKVVEKTPVEEVAEEKKEEVKEIKEKVEEAPVEKEDKNPVKEESKPDEAPTNTEESSEEIDTSNISFGENKEDERLWYVINTYSGYEDNVCQALKQRIDSMDMSDKIFDVIVPKEKKVEIKNGKKKIVEKKIFPGYVLVQMEVDEDSWYVVRNTPSVTGFIGFGNTPTALSVDEVKNIQKRMGIEEPEFKIDYEIGESVKIVDGPFKDFDGVISDIDKIRGKIKVLVSMFGRETPVELDALQIQRI